MIDDLVFSGALDEQTVRAVRFDCADGKLTWKYPSGAMIVRIWAPHDRAVWRFCIRPLIDHTPIVLLYRKGTNAEILVSHRSSFYPLRFFVQTTPR